LGGDFGMFRSGMTISLMRRSFLTLPMMAAAYPLSLCAAEVRRIKQLKAVIHSLREKDGLPSNESKLQTDVEELVPTATALAITSYSSFSKDQQFSGAVAVFAKDLESWDFFMAAAFLEAAVFGAAFDRKIDEVGPLIDKKVNEWKPDGLRCLADSAKFVENSLKGIPLKKELPAFQERFRDALGMWVLWNLHHRAPTLEEARPARAIGSMAAEFLYWWE
jgi:hypothetical protein